MIKEADCFLQEMEILDQDDIIGGKVDEANSGEENEILIEDREKFGLTLTDSELEKDADVVDITLCTAASKMKQP